MSQPNLITKNFDGTVKDFFSNGEPLIDKIMETVKTTTISANGVQTITEEQKLKKEVPVTFKFIALRALCNETQEDKLTPECRAEYGAIASKLYMGGDVALTPKEITTIRDRVAKSFASPMLIVQMNELLDKQ